VKSKAENREYIISQHPYMKDPVPIGDRYAHPPELTREQQESIAEFDRILSGKNYSGHTLRNYRSAFRVFLGMTTPQDPRAMSDQDILSFLKDRFGEQVVSPARRNLMVHALKCWYEGMTGKKLDTGMTPRPVRRSETPRVLSREEVTEIIRRAGQPKHRCLLQLAYATGMRVSELTRIRMDDINLRRRRLKVRDSEDRINREVDLPVSCCNAIRSYLREAEPQRYLFEGTAPGTPYAVRSAQQVILKAVQRAGLSKKVSLQTLRHSFAEHSLEDGADLAELQKKLGHKSKRTTSIYNNITRDASHEDGATPA